MSGWLIALEWQGASAFSAVSRTIDSQQSIPPPMRSFLPRAGRGGPTCFSKSMACGTPVVASNIGGAAEFVTDTVGVLMPERTVAGVAVAVERLFEASLSRTAIRSYAEKFSWDETTEGQVRLFREILATGDAGAKAPRNSA